MTKRELTLYLDESIRDEVHVVAGYLARAEAWDKAFLPAWRGLLRKHGLDEFKTQHCSQGAGAFRSVEPQARDAIRYEFVEVLQNFCADEGAMGFAVAVVHPGLLDATVLDRRTTRSFRRNLEKHGYTHAITWLTRLVARACSLMNSECLMVLDRRDGFIAGVREALASARDRSALAEFKLVDGPIMNDSKHAVPIQAADFLAYESMREVFARVSDEPPTHTIKRLVRTNQHYGQIVTQTHFDDIMDQKRDRLCELFAPNRHLRNFMNWPYAPTSV